MGCIQGPGMPVSGIEGAAVFVSGWPGVTKPFCFVLAHRRGVAKCGVQLGCGEGVSLAGGRCMVGLVDME